MKIQWKKWFAVVVVASAAPASAIPVTFDFTGTVGGVVDFDSATNLPVYDLSTVGQAFSAQFVIDTDLFGLGTPTASDVGDRLSYSTELPGAMTASLQINGEAIDLAPYGRNRTNLSFLDSNGIVSCGENCSRLAPDQFNITRSSDNAVLPMGPTAARTVSFSFEAGFGYEDPELALSWLDLTPDFDIQQLGSISLPASVRPSLFLTDYSFTCTADRCQQSGFHRTMFDVTSAVRTVSSVPEPGTPGLLAIGAAGAILASRRRRAVRA